MKDAIEYLIAFAAFAALLVVSVQIHKSKILRRDAGSFFGVVIVGLGGLLYEARFIPNGQATQLAIFGLLVGSLIVAIASTDRRSTRFSQISWPVFIPSGIASVMFLSNAVMNPNLPLYQSFGRLLSVCFLIVVGVTISMGAIKLVDVLRLLAASVLLILVISPFASGNWRACDIFKCGPFGAIYTGPFLSENALAIFVCIGMMCCLLTARGWSRALCLFPLVLVLYATESRTSQLSIAAGLTAWAIARFCQAASRREKSGAPQSASKGVTPLVLLFSFAAFGIAIIGFGLIFSAEPSSFSNRGNIWIRGMTALGNSWVTGLGLDRWSFLQSIGLLPPLFPHSEYLLLLFGGGIVAVLLLQLSFAYALKFASRDDFPFAASYVTFLAILGLTEAYWNPMAFDGHTLLLLPIMTLSQGIFVSRAAVVRRAPIHRHHRQDPLVAEVDRLPAGDGPQERRAADKSVSGGRLYAHAWRKL